ncbi:Selenocysteine-specific translation elongation factor [Sulfitobacter noctilucicola]|uniref:Selenocysteine-specific elongation factor n=1 Tax=Sulfitobacter noctilucicola TaxID=1342301 RepID=A0A7W6MAQ1_9RHOB|nr:selenocysteine-specific translation elongation factor [Sulfitobacter noctilucicola]KIN64271.1 Selenocysteine-specific translation elongation factor [Sulfitobacter noctilucicola]MBB4174561.1 selenocysteine-specific elongation factor [Sulfitobacter noctilucicola]
MTTRCVVVIGHVDHGKTALVRALTGTETDRLAEEKERGLSITPGFAYCKYDRGIIDLVDAPGHADFVQAMVAGASGASAALLVVSATDGIGVQTQEHLAIAAALGIDCGVVAVTKSDALPAGAEIKVLPDLKQALRGSALEDAPMILCSALRGDGIAKIHDALEALLSLSPAKNGPLHSFLPIDRAFSVEGRGTVVTGTLSGGGLRTSDTLTVLPAGRSVTLRGLQSRAQDRKAVRPGERVAANLRGVSVSEVSRGSVLCAEGQFVPSTCLDVHLALIPGTKIELRHMQDVRLLIGTQSVTAQLRLFGRRMLASGEAGTAQLRLSKPIVGFAGQRAVLRRLSPAQTLAGVDVLDPNAVPAGGGDKARSCILEAALEGPVTSIAAALAAANRGAVSIEDVARLARMHIADVRAALAASYVALDAETLAARIDAEACRTAILKNLSSYHARHPLRSVAPLADISPTDFAPALLNMAYTTLKESGEIRQRANKVGLRRHDPTAFASAEQLARMDDFEMIFRQGGLASPAFESLSKTDEDAEILTLLLDRGQLLSLENIGLKQTVILHCDTVLRSAKTLDGAFPNQGRFTTGAARDALGTSRRVIVPLLEYFDSIGVTQRDGDLRCVSRVNKGLPQDTD